jgi:hypothetical protein
MFIKSLAIISLTTTLVHSLSAAVAVAHRLSTPIPPSQSLNAHELEELKTLYKHLIDAENSHDIAAVRPLVWESKNALFVAKTATPAEGNWAGFWGTDVVLEQLDDLYKAGPFGIEPDYDNEKVVALSRDVAETYAPVNITVPARLRCRNRSS